MGEQIQSLLPAVKRTSPLPRRLGQPAPASRIVMGQAKVDAKLVVRAEIHRQHPCPLLMGSLGQSGHDGGGPHASPDPLQGDRLHADLPSPVPSGPFTATSASRGKRAHKAASRSLAAIS
ncbi:hypothetical protein KAM471c_06570 [Aeromonas caviae]|nr:hypothetical protein KAM471c_06570 [Aeromonas caviae]